MRRVDLRPGRVLLLPFVGALMLMATGPAAADDCETGSVIRGGGGEAGVECPGSGTGGSGPAPGGGGGGAVACTPARAADPDAWWISYDVPDEAFPDEDSRSGVRATNPPEGQTFAVWRDCYGERRSMVIWVPIPEPGDGDGDDGILTARQDARARVEPAAPTVAVSPAQAVVRVPTWLWVDGGYWRPTSASSTTPGGVTVTVDAVPVRATWNLDEGVRVCDGPGVPWSPEAQVAYELQATTVRGSGDPACTFTFVNASSTRSSGVFDASATVLWEFAWSLDGVDQGVFGTVEVSQGFSLRVGEVQAVITG